MGHHAKINIDSHGYQVLKLKYDLAPYLQIRMFMYFFKKYKNKNNFEEKCVQFIKMTTTYVNITFEVVIKSSSQQSFQ